MPSLWRWRTTSTSASSAITCRSPTPTCCARLSGAIALGVNAGLVQGTPGGTTGAHRPVAPARRPPARPAAASGGTSIGVGGAGSGAAGIVASTQGEGPPLDSYDPVITGNVSFQRAITPESNTIITGTNTLYQNTTTANFLYTPGLPDRHADDGGLQQQPQRVECAVQHAEPVR